MSGLLILFEIVYLMDPIAKPGERLAEVALGDLEGLILKNPAYLGKLDIKTLGFVSDLVTAKCWAEEAASVRSRILNMWSRNTKEPQSPVRLEVLISKISNEDFIFRYSFFEFKGANKVLEINRNYRLPKLPSYIRWVSQCQ